MTKLAGVVAIIRDGAVAEYRDLGPDPVEVKANVLPVRDTKPELSEGMEYGEPNAVVFKTLVRRTYPVQEVQPDPPSLEDRLAALEASVDALKATLK